MSLRRFAFYFVLLALLATTAYGEQKPTVKTRAVVKMLPAVKMSAMRQEITQSERRIVPLPVSPQRKRHHAR